MRNENYLDKEDDIDFILLFDALWKGRVLVILFSFIFATMSVFYAINLPNIYRANAIIMPAETEQGGGFGALAGQLGGLANLAGVNLGNGSSQKSQIALNIMRSRKFVSMFIEKYDLLPDLMAGESWDRTTEKLVYDEKLYHSKTNLWVRKPKPHLKPKPSMQEAYREFQSVFSLSENTDEGTINLSIDHISPVIAEKWVGLLVSEINVVMRDREVAEAQRSIQYLKRQIEETKITDIKDVLYKLVEEQAKTIMFANVRDEYVFKTIDPAVVAEERLKPNRILICLLGTFLGFGLAVIVVLSRHFSKKSQ